MPTDQPAPRRSNHLRAFVAWSLILHVGAGISWGMPAILSLGSERELEQAKKAWADNLVKETAKARSHAQQQRTQAIQREVEAQVRQQFDKLAAVLAEPKRDKLWEAVAARLQQQTLALATALGRANLTAQDLASLEAQLQRDLVEQTDQALTAEKAEELAEGFIAQVDGQVAPDLAKWMRDQIRERVANRLREEAEQLAREQSDGARQEREAGRLAVQAAGAQLETAEATALRDRQDAAASGKRFSEAGQNLAEADKQLAIAQDSTPDVGSALKDQLAAARLAVRRAQDAASAAAQTTSAETRPQAVAAADQAIAAAKQATQAAGNALGGADDREAHARQEIRQAGEGALKESVELAFAGELRNETLPRLTPKLAKAFQEQLTKSGITDEKLVEAVAKRASDLLASKVPALAKAGEPVEERLRDLAPDRPAVAAGPVKPAPAAMAPSALDLKLDAGKAKMAANAKVNLGQIAKDGRPDEEWVKKAASAGGPDAAMEDLRDRIGNMANGMRNGRLGDATTEIGSGFGSLRQRALGHGKGDFLATGGDHRDEAASRAMSQQIADRGQVQGAAWERSGATGETSQAAAREGLVPARAVGHDNAKAKVETGSTEPYRPAFKSLAFTAIPCLPDTFAIDGKPEKWQGIPALTLKPEVPEDATVQTVQVGWRRDGLFFRYTIVDPDRQVTKTLARAFWRGDVAEVFIDSLNAKDSQRSRHSGQQFWVWPAGSLDDPTVTGGENVKATRQSPWSCRLFHADVMPRVTVPTDQGYLLEFQLTAALIEDADLAAGRILGFNCMTTPSLDGNWFWTTGRKMETYRTPDNWGDLLLAGSDATLALASSPTPTSPTVLLPGQPLSLRVVDGDMNLSPLRRDKVMVTLKPGHGGQLISVLEETGEASGVFEGSLSTALVLDEDQPGILAVYEGETVVASYTDQARANGARNVEVKLKLSFGSAMVQRVVAR